MSEWGLFPADEKHGSSLEARKQGGPGPKSLVAQTEADLFKALGLAFIPPELREGMGEIEAAEKSALPELLEEADIRGVFHNHTTASDGHNTLEEMVAAGFTPAQALTSATKSAAEWLKNDQIGVIAPGKSGIA